MAKKVTIREIASEAGVSIATVSRVINNSASVDEETRSHVRKIIERQQYSPSAAARNLSTQESHTIGIIVPEIDNPYFGNMLQTLAVLADENRYTLVFYITENKPRKDLQALGLLKNDLTKGVIYVPSFCSNQPEILTAISQFLDNMTAPVVAVDRDLDLPCVDKVLFDNEQAAYLATRILIAAGHTRIGFIGGLPSANVEQHRLEGYLRAHRESGLAPDRNVILEDDFTIPMSYRLSKHLLQMEMRPTAVITCNNTISLGYFQASTEDNGLNAHTVEHIGFGDLEMLDYLHIEYNHISHDVVRLANEAVDLLFSRFSNPNRNYETRVLPRQFKLSDRLSQIALRNGILTAGQILEKGF